MGADPGVLGDEPRPLGQRLDAQGGEQGRPKMSKAWSPSTALAGGADALAIEGRAHHCRD
jgi:hypothetical protein